MVNDDEFGVFVGPSGCGKSTLLRVIAGLESPTSGEIRIDRQSVNGVSAADRGCAMVFQSYALYPHMTVYDNMAFGLENIRVPKAPIEAKVTGEGALPLGEEVAVELTVADVAARRIRFEWRDRSAPTLG